MSGAFQMRAMGEVIRGTLCAGVPQRKAAAADLHAQPGLWDRTPGGRPHA